MGLHSGDGRLGGDNYVGTDVNRAARIAAAGHGGQVLLSDATRALVAQRLPAGVTIRDLGSHRLKDLPEPERIWQLEIDGLANEFPEIRSLDARPNNLPLPAASLIGRTAELAAIVVLVRERRLVTLTGPGGTGKTRGQSSGLVGEKVPTWSESWLALHPLDQPVMSTTQKRLPSGSARMT